MPRIPRDDGFSLTELMVATTIMLLVTGAALTTFQNGLMLNESSSQMADANQNLRAGTNQLIRDIMQAGRIIGPEGIPIPSGTGALAINRPSPPGGSALVFEVSTTTNLPDITTGYELGPLVNGERTDMLTIMTVDAFMPVIETPPAGVFLSPPTTTVDIDEGAIAADGASITLPNTSIWLVGDVNNDTAAAQVGDLVLFKNSRGMAIQTVTGKDETHLFFAANDSFRFNQRTAPSGSLMQIKDVNDTTTTWSEKTSLFRVLMITYYVDNVTTPGVPRLVRRVNDFPAQALAGVVEDLDLTYDLVDGVNNPTNITELPHTVTIDGSPVTYNSNQIRKVNIHMGVRSEMISRPTQDFIRSHISTAVDVRSLASVDRYVGQ